MLHSAAWDESVEWKNKKVAIIGTGSSAIQITPKVQKGKQSVIRGYSTFNNRRK